MTMGLTRSKSRHRRAPWRVTCSTPSTGSSRMTLLLLSRTPLSEEWVESELACAPDSSYTPVSEYLSEWVHRLLALYSVDICMYTIQCEQSVCYLSSYAPWKDHMCFLTCRFCLSLISVMRKKRLLSRNKTGKYQSINYQDHAVQ